MKRITMLTLFGWLVAAALFAQANGKLQIHFIDVGQGDGALLISPQGTVVLFDAGEDLNRKDCTLPLAYLDQLGIAKIDYLFVSHYHSDHIGCIPDVLKHFPLQHEAYDRGGKYKSATFDRYVAAVSSHRTTAKLDQVITLDAGSTAPVAIKVVALNATSDNMAKKIITSNENDLSLSVTVSFARFHAEIGGDLSGDDTSSYKDIETWVAPNVGHVDVYKVHHHCSSHSTNDEWLHKTTPAVGVVSVGVKNSYQHPADDCLERLHQAGVRLYWTETGNGGEPQPDLDVVAGDVLVQVDPGATTFSVTPHSGQVQTYAIGGSAAVQNGEAQRSSAAPRYAWSTKSTSHVYHYPDCAYARRIDPANLQTGSTPPDGWTLHEGCPTGKQQ